MLCFVAMCCVLMCCVLLGLLVFVVFVALCVSDRGLRCMLCCCISVMRVFDLGCFALCCVLLLCLML